MKMFHSTKLHFVEWNILTILTIALINIHYLYNDHIDKLFINILAIVTLFICTVWADFI